MAEKVESAVFNVEPYRRAVESLPIWTAKDSGAATADDSLRRELVNADWCQSFRLLISPVKGGCRIVNKYGTVTHLKHLLCSLWGLESVYSYFR